MSNILPALKRKSRTARQVVQQGDWSGLMQKSRNNLSAILDPVAEAYQLGQDAIVHTYWRRRHHADEAPPKSTMPFSIGPIAKREQPKNIIWIMLDALRQDIFEGYLKRDGLSDILKESVYFPRAFAQGSWTYPSVFSFLTGLYPFNCGVSKLTYDNGSLVSLCSDFDDSCPTIFSILRQREYQVASILDGWGFTVRNTAGQEHREDHYFEQNWGWIYGQDRRFLSLTEQRDATTSFVRSASKQAPFMLFVRSLYTHSPYREIFKSAEYVNELSRRGWAFRIIEGFIRGLQKFETVYLKSLLTALAETNQLQNTIIIISSDHGEMFWNLENDIKVGYPDSGYPEEEIWRHQLEPYNALTKVPLIIWGADMRGVFPDRFRLVDIVPTLLEEIGVEFNPSDFDGVSIRNTTPRPLYADSAGYGFGGIAFQDNGAKFLTSRRLGSVAYDITDDECERLDLRRDASHNVDELVEFVQQTSRNSQVISSDDDEEVLFRRLQALGYVD